MRALLLGLLSTLPSLAQAADIQLTWSARLTDTTGTPINGSQDIEVHIYDAASGGTSLYSESLTLDAQQGYVSAILGTSGGLDSGLFGSANRYVGVRIGTPAFELSTRTLLTSVPTAAVSASLDLTQSGGCDDGNRGVFHYDAGTLQVCTVDGWRAVIGASGGAGDTNATPGVSCASILEQDASAATGQYWLDPDGQGAFLAYCDMDTYQGGWTLALKANNGDATNFYANHTLLSSGNTLNTGSQTSAARGDYLGESFSRVSGSEVLLRDCVGTNNGRGRFLVDAPLADVIEYSQTRAFGNVEQCGLMAIDTEFAGTTLGDAPRTHIGFSCEDDTSSRWVPDDDASVISWYDRDGGGANSTAHTTGIAKVGTDGGDDVINGANVSRDACVMVFWR